MKKLIAIILTLTFVGAIVFFGIFVFRSANIESVEIDGAIQTCYFANAESANNVNFNDANLKITYKDGSVKLKKLTNDLVSVKDFNSSVVNKGTMKITYKSHTIDVDYSVIWTGLYYVSLQNSYAYTTKVSTTTLGPYTAGVDENNNDTTTSKEMIYFYSDGSCDYYSKVGNSWYLDDGYFDSNFNYTISGDTINVNLGEDKNYKIKTNYTDDGELTLVSTEEYYISSGDEQILRRKVEKKFNHYNMKTNRTFEEENFRVYSPDGAIKFKKNSTYESNEQKIYLEIEFNNDNFMKKVYVNFKSKMFQTPNELNTSIVTDPVETFANCFYKGFMFEINYVVYE